MAASVCLNFFLVAVLQALDELVKQHGNGAKNQDGSNQHIELEYISGGKRQGQASGAVGTAWLVKGGHTMQRLRPATGFLKGSLQENGTVWYKLPVSLSVVHYL